MASIDDDHVHSQYLGPPQQPLDDHVRSRYPGPPQQSQQQWGAPTSLSLAPSVGYQGMSDWHTPAPAWGRGLTTNTMTNPVYHAGQQSFSAGQPQTYSSGNVMSGLPQIPAAPETTVALEDQAPTVDEAYAKYLIDLQNIFEKINNGMLTSASKLLLSASGWLLSHVKELSKA